MRKLVLLRGAQGSGKSTFIKKQNLEGYAISPDSIRLLMGGVVMGPEGRIVINPANDKRVWEEIERLLDEKMARGEFVVFDATFQRTRDFSMQLKLARKHLYRVYCVDFTSIPVETALERNRKREDYKQVPDEVIIRAYERFKESKIPKEITVFPYTEFEDSSLIEKIDIEPFDLNQYKKIHHIGDLQGCYDPIAKYFADNGGFKDDEYYIFVGDFLDRGIQNGEVIRWIVDEVLPRRNVALIWGNHETHIHRYATGQPPVSKEFEYNTYPQIEKAGFTKKEAGALCYKLRDCFVYYYGELKCLVSHAGIASIPKNLVLLPSHQFWKGTGTYEHPVDQIFSDNMKDSHWIQVHGHRNSKNLMMKAAAKSYNLEAEVEFGGNQRILTIAKDGVFEEIEIRNNTFRKQNPNFSALSASSECKISQLTLDGLISHDFVNCKKFVTYSHITSYNFSRKAFTKGIWDKVSLAARGLFVDEERNIVARSYNKFFNLEERPETQMRNLERNLAFPMTLYVKENGFLGILGYDAMTDNLFFASKSTPESEFAGWFKEILSETVGISKLDYLRRNLRDRNLSLVFEVNDPINDPHMIEYENRHVVLLDAVYRTEEFKRLPMHELEMLAKSYNLPCKQKGIVFKDWDSFKGWYSSVEKQGMDFTYRGKHVEGFVIEDSKGFMFKIKLPYYSFWKYMRSLKERIITMRETGNTDLRRDISEPEALAFYEWAMMQNDELLAKDIITLRKQFLESFR